MRYKRIDNHCIVVFHDSHMPGVKKECKCGAILPCNNTLPCFYHNSVNKMLSVMYNPF